MVFGRIRGGDGNTYGMGVLCRLGRGERESVRESR